MDHLCFFLILIKNLQTKGPKGNMILYVILIKKMCMRVPHIQPSIRNCVSDPVIGCLQVYWAKFRRHRVWSHSITTYRKHSLRSQRGHRVDHALSYINLQRGKGITENFQGFYEIQWISDKISENSKNVQVMYFSE